MNNKKNEKERKKKWNEKLRNFVRCIKLCCEVETLLKKKRKKKMTKNLRVRDIRNNFYCKREYF